MVSDARRLPAARGINAFASVSARRTAACPLPFNGRVRQVVKEREPEMNPMQWLQEEEIKRLEAMLDMPSAPEREPSRQEVRVEVQRVRKQKAE